MTEDDPCEVRDSMGFIGYNTEHAQALVIFAYSRTSRDKTTNERNLPVIESGLFLIGWILFLVFGILGFAAALLTFIWVFENINKHTRKNEPDFPSLICFSGTGITFSPLAWVVGTYWLDLPVTAWIGWGLFLVLGILALAAALLGFCAVYQLVRREWEIPPASFGILGLIFSALAWLAWVVGTYWLDLAGIAWIHSFIAWLLFFGIPGTGFLLLKMAVNKWRYKSPLFFVYFFGAGLIFTALAWIVGAYWLDLAEIAWILSLIAWIFFLILGVLWPFAVAYCKFRSLIFHYKESEGFHLNQLSALADILGPAAVGPLITIIQSGRDSFPYTLVLEAACILARRGDVRSASPLIGYVKNKEEKKEYVGWVGNSSVKDLLESLLFRFAQQFAVNDLKTVACLRDWTYYKIESYQVNEGTELPGDWGFRTEDWVSKSREIVVNYDWFRIREMAEREINRRISERGKKGDSGTA